MITIGKYLSKCLTFTFNTDLYNNLSGWPKIPKLDFKMAL